MIFRYFGISYTTTILPHQTLRSEVARLTEKVGVLSSENISLRTAARIEADTADRLHRTVTHYESETNKLRIMLMEQKQLIADLISATGQH
jgi:hypothetical protein